MKCLVSIINWKIFNAIKVNIMPYYKHLTADLAFLIILTSLKKQGCVFSSSS